MDKFSSEFYKNNPGSGVRLAKTAGFIAGTKLGTDLTEAASAAVAPRLSLLKNKIATSIGKRSKNYVPIAQDPTAGVADALAAADKNVNNIGGSTRKTIVARVANDPMSEKISRGELIKRVANKKIKTAHVTESPAFNKFVKKTGNEIQLRAFPEQASGMRKAADELHFYRSVPTKNGNTQLYTGYLSDIPGGSGSLPKKFTLRKPHPKAFLENVKVSYSKPLPGESQLQYTQRVMGNPAASGKTTLAAENVIGGSKEAQVVTNAAFTGVEGTKYPGSTIVFKGKKGFTYIKTKTPYQSKISKFFGLDTKQTRVDLFDIETKATNEAKNLMKPLRKSNLKLNKIPHKNKQVLNLNSYSRYPQYRHITPTDIISSPKSMSSLGMSSSLFSKWKSSSLLSSIFKDSKASIVSSSNKSSKPKWSFSSSMRGSSSLLSSIFQDSRTSLMPRSSKPSRSSKSNKSTKSNKKSKPSKPVRSSSSTGFVAYSSKPSKPVKSSKSSSKPRRSTSSSHKVSMFSSYKSTPGLKWRIHNSKKKNNNLSIAAKKMNELLAATDFLRRL